MTKYLAIIILACTLTVISTTASAENDFYNLRSLITSFEDSRISSADLAFFLATHNYDAVPRIDHVDLFIDGMIYRLVPNGNAPGLCDVQI